MGVYRKIPMERYHEIRDQFNAGAQPRDIAKAWECSINTVHSILQFCGIPAWEYKNPLKVKVFTRSMLNEQRVEIVNKFNTGATRKELAIEYKCSVGKIHGILRKAGITRKLISNLPQSYYDELKAKLENGVTRKELAIEYGCAMSTLGAMLRRAGVPLYAHTAKGSNRKPLGSFAIHYGVRHKYQLFIMYCVLQRTLREIAKSLGVSAPTVGKALTQLGIPLRETGRRK